MTGQSVLIDQPLGTISRVLPRLEIQSSAGFSGVECHAERSEASSSVLGEILRSAHNDNFPFKSGESCLRKNAHDAVTIDN